MGSTTRGFLLKTLGEDNRCNYLDNKGLLFFLMFLETFGGWGGKNALGGGESHSEREGFTPPTEARLTVYLNQTLVGKIPGKYVA